MIGSELGTRVLRLVDEREPFVVATVIRARRPTSVHPGDSAIVLGDGTIDGFVGGVCAESSVRLHAARVLETGEPLLLRLVADDAVTESDAEDGIVVEHNPCLSGGALEIFLEPRLPAPRVTIVGGSSPIARALAAVTRAAGYEMCSSVVADAVAVIVASHGSGEEQALDEALAAGVPYVALVASRERGEAVRASLDVPDELRAQLHTPAGLDIGARTPAEVAISILAQLVAQTRARPAPRPGTPVAAAPDHHCCQTG